MRNVWWMVLAAAGLFLAKDTANADERASSLPAVVSDNTATAPEPPKADAPAAEIVPSPKSASTSPPIMATGPSCANGNCSNACSGGCGSACGDCGCRTGSFSRIKKLAAWMFYMPLDRGKPKCCGCACSAPPPAWVFFPCLGKSGGCSTCGTSPAVLPQVTTVQYAKAPGAKVSQPVMLNQQPAPAGSPGIRISTYQPTVIKRTMPVLEPTQFRKAPPACASCGGGKSN